MDGYDWGWAWWDVAHMILWPVLIILGIVVLVRWLARSTAAPHQDRSESALDILRKRYARGEIGKEEFEQGSATWSREAPDRIGASSAARNESTPCRRAVNPKWSPHHRAALLRWL